MIFFVRNSSESSNGSSQIKHNEHEMCIEKDKTNHHKIKWFKSRQKILIKEIFWKTEQNSIKIYYK